MVNSDQNTAAQIIMCGQQLEEVTVLKHLGVPLTKDGRSTVNG